MHPHDAAAPSPSRPLAQFELVAAGVAWARVPSESRSARRSRPSRDLRAGATCEYEGARGLGSATGTGPKMALVDQHAQKIVGQFEVRVNAVGCFGW